MQSHILPFPRWCFPSIQMIRQYSTLFHIYHGIFKSHRNLIACPIHRWNRYLKLCPVNLLTVCKKNGKSIKNRCIYKEIFVCDCKDVVAVKINRDILIIELHLLHLWRSLSLSAVADAVSAEITISRPVAEISTICEEPLAVSVLFVD